MLAEAGKELDQSTNETAPEALDQTEAIESQDGSVPATEEELPPRNPLMQFLPLIAIFVVMYFFLLRGPKKKQQKHTQMVKSLQKNDKVQTIGGAVEFIQNEL